MTHNASQTRVCLDTTTRRVVLTCVPSGFNTTGAMASRFYDGAVT